MSIEVDCSTRTIELGCWEAEDESLGFSYPSGAAQHLLWGIRTK